MYIRAMSIETEMRSKFDRELDLTTWRDLRSHAARDVVFVLRGGLGLVDVGVAIATDDKAVIERAIAAATLVRPSAEEMDAWEKNLGKTFQCLIVSPYVLVVEIEIEEN